MELAIMQKPIVVTLLILTLLLIFSVPALADDPTPTALGDANNTTTYVFYVNGYYIAMTPFAYVITTMGYDVCQALFWCN
jgi:hypothetical protein